MTACLPTSLPIYVRVSISISAHLSIYRISGYWCDFFLFDKVSNHTEGKLWTSHSQSLIVKVYMYCLNLCHLCNFLSIPRTNLCTQYMYTTTHVSHKFPNILVPKSLAVFCHPFCFTPTVYQYACITNASAYPEHSQSSWIWLVWRSSPKPPTLNSSLSVPPKRMPTNQLQVSTSEK